MPYVNCVSASVTQDYVYSNYFLYSYSDSKIFHQPCTEVPKNISDLYRIIQKSVEELEISLYACP